MKHRLVPLLGCVLALLAPARAGDPPKLADFKVDAKELPEGVTLVEGVHCASPQPATFFNDPTMGGFLADPAGKLCQSFRNSDGAMGSVLVFQYKEDVPEFVRGFMPGYLWGEGSGPTAQHPEEYYCAGPFLVILSFPGGAAPLAWCKDRLRTRTRMPVPRLHPEQKELMQKAGKAYGAQDAKAGLALLDGNEAIKEFAFGQYLLGEFGGMAGDYAIAEKGYARAVALHDSRVDPLDPQILGPALDGLGVACLAQGKCDDAIKALLRARDEAIGDEMTLHICYNLACAYARAGRFDEAREMLHLVVTEAPEMKEQARKDPDLAEARKRKDFADLLKD